MATLQNFPVTHLSPMQHGNGPYQQHHQNSRYSNISNNSSSSRYSNSGSNSPIVYPRNGLATPPNEQQEVGRSNLRDDNNNNNRPTTPPPPPPPKDDIVYSPNSSHNNNFTTSTPSKIEAYFLPPSSSRTNSIYTLSRASFSNQISALTSLKLPDANSLSSSVRAIPSAQAATTALSNAALQIQRWITKAAEVLGSLDADDDIEWAAAGGRDGIGDVDAAVSQFEGLISVYVAAIEELQSRPDIDQVPAAQLIAVMDMVDEVLASWEGVRSSRKTVKLQVELAMEWEELWNSVLGDIGMEMEALARLVFELEEKRYRNGGVIGDEATLTLMSGGGYAQGGASTGTLASIDGQMNLDIQELENVVSESATATLGKKESGSSTGAKASKGLMGLLPAFPTSHSIEAPEVMSPGHEDAHLLSLFARMQPLRASLDFLPMRLSHFEHRAEKIFPSGVQDLVERRTALETKWKKLEADAECLRQELAEDRWVYVFRTASRQAQKMCESVERGIVKVQEAVDGGFQHSNPPLLAKRIGDYEAKKSNYGPAIQKVLGVIDKGAHDRVTINGEVLRLQAMTQAAWDALEKLMIEMDAVIEDITQQRTQQLRDSITTLMSTDLSAAASAMATPGSSPASSIVMTSTNGKKGPAVSEFERNSRRSSVRSISSTRPSNTRRDASRSSATTQSTRPARRSSLSRPPLSSSPASSSTVRTPSSLKAATSAVVDNKPRWNSSPVVDYSQYKGYNVRKASLQNAPLTLSLSKPRVNSYSNYRSATHSVSSTGTLQSSPLSHHATSSPMPHLPTPSRDAINNPRSRPSGAQTSLAIRSRRNTSPSPMRNITPNQSKSNPSNRATSISNTTTATNGGPRSVRTTSRPLPSPITTTMPLASSSPLNNGNTTPIAAAIPSPGFVRPRSRLYTPSANPGPRVSSISSTTRKSSANRAKTSDSRNNGATTIVLTPPKQDHPISPSAAQYFKDVGQYPDHDSYDQGAEDEGNNDHDGADHFNEVDFYNSPQLRVLNSANGSTPPQQQQQQQQMHPSPSSSTHFSPAITDSPSFAMRRRAMLQQSGNNSNSSNSNAGAVNVPTVGSRPVTSMGHGERNRARRVSLLPVPKVRVPSGTGRESVLGLGLGLEE